MDFMMWKRKFKDAAKHKGLMKRDILLELPKWFPGLAKEIIETAAIGTMEETAEEEVTATFKKMDTVFMAAAPTSRRSTKLLLNHRFNQPTTTDKAAEHKKNCANVWRIATML